MIGFSALMVLGGMGGGFVFSLHSASYDELEHHLSHKWTSHERIGTSDALQNVGLGSEEITLNGVIYPEFAGSTLSLRLLEDMMSKGQPYFLVSGGGKIYGQFVITGIQKKQSDFFNDGAPQKTEFSVSLQRYDNAVLLFKGIAGAVSSLF